MDTRSSILQVDVHVSSRLPLAIKHLNEPSSFSPVSCTLIHGANSAVLVDTPFSISQTEDVAAWIKTTAPEKDLCYLYITRGHGDHWLGTATLRKLWPNLRALATPGTIPAVGEMELAEATSPSTFELEAHEFHVVEVGHMDTFNTTVLHVPSIRLVVEADAIYGDASILARPTRLPKGRSGCAHSIRLRHWTHRLVAGHKRAGAADGLINLHKTRQYILDFEDAVAKASNWKEVAEDVTEMSSTIWETKTSPGPAPQFCYARSGLLGF
ncbi:beta-lactamase-like protein [Aspergillus pseudodeflectus]|uniref:Beta-lactamase-like protein n=1 Tax=Aspergillus pseudodeflectus TaxID=176178 RepID=A0ABR4L4I8_9EURO